MPAQRRPSVFDVPTTLVSPFGASHATAARVDEADSLPSEKQMMRTSLYLSRAVHDKLREIAFAERKKVHELFIEGIDKVLSARGFPSTGELRDKA